MLRLVPEIVEVTIIAQLSNYCHHYDLVDRCSPAPTASDILITG
jgi:hypothetical protein